MVIEAGVVAGVRDRVGDPQGQAGGGRLDAEADGVIDASLDRLHEVVAAKLGGHPALADWWRRRRPPTTAARSAT